jgi:hypothetical protein
MGLANTWNQNSSFKLFYNIRNKPDKCKNFKTIKNSIHTE